MKIKLIILSMFLLIPPPKTVYAQIEVPVVDYLGRWLSKTTHVVQEAISFVHLTAAPLVKTFGDVQDFFKKAKTVVNGVIKNMRMLEDIVELNEEIGTLVQKSIDAINETRDEDGDGIDDLNFLDKWKHVQIILAISAEASKGFEIFIKMIQADALVMDDKGRLKFIQQTLYDLRKIRSAIKVQIRRINKEVYQYQRLKKEAGVYSKLFSTN